MQYWRKHNPREKWLPNIYGNRCSIHWANKVKDKYKGENQNHYWSKLLIKPCASSNKKVTITQSNSNVGV